MWQSEYPAGPDSEYSFFTPVVLSRDEHSFISEVLSRDEHSFTSEALSRDEHSFTSEVLSRDEHSFLTPGDLSAVEGGFTHCRFLGFQQPNDGVGITRSASNGSARHT